MTVDASVLTFAVVTAVEKVDYDFFKRKYFLNKD